MNLRNFYLVLFCIGCIFGFVAISDCGSDAQSEKEITIDNTVYEMPDNVGYDTSKGHVVSTTAFGVDSFVKYTLEDRGGSDINSTTHDGIDLYGMKTAAVIKIHVESLNLTDLNQNTNWFLSNDSWGGIRGENAYGIATGQIGNGKIVVQTYDEENNKWVNIAGKGIISVGKGDIVIDIAGENFQKGMKLRIITFYEIGEKYQVQKWVDKNWWSWLTGKKKLITVDAYRYLNMMEMSAPFMVVSNDVVNSVTFKNLSLFGDNPTSQIIVDSKQSNESKNPNSVNENDKILEDYISETLLNGSLATNGFTVYSINKYLQISIERNGEKCTIPEDWKFTEDGCYSIVIKSLDGTKSKTLIYVESEAKPDDFFKNLFYNSERVFDSQSDIPVYITGMEYSAVFDPLDRCPISKATLYNADTKKEIDISDIPQGKIKEPGIYVFTFEQGNSSSGDLRIFQYSFKTIGEGNVSGPTVNKSTLYSSDGCYPEAAYAVIYKTAGVGNIVMLYSSKEKAMDGVFNEEMSTVKKINEKYYYAGLNPYTVEYDNEIALNKAVHDVCAKRVIYHYFDMSDSNSYRTISQTTLNSLNNVDLRSLNLHYSVVLYASKEDKKELTIDRIPVIGMKTEFLSIDDNGEFSKITTGYTTHKFVKDRDGVESYSVKIGSDSKIIDVEYGKDIYQLLKDAGFETGILSVNECNIYGRQVSYKFLFNNPDLQSNPDLFFKSYDNSMIKISNNEIYKFGDYIKLDCVSNTSSWMLIRIVSHGLNDSNTYLTSQNVSSYYFECGKYTIYATNLAGQTISCNLLIDNEDPTIEQPPYTGEYEFITGIPIDFDNVEDSNKIIIDFIPGDESSTLPDDPIIIDPVEPNDFSEDMVPDEKVDSDKFNSQKQNTIGNFFQKLSDIFFNWFCHFWLTRYTLLVI